MFLGIAAGAAIGDFTNVISMADYQYGIQYDFRPYQVGYALVSPQKTKNVIEESKSVAEKVRGFISIMTLTFRI